jgi:hypothetical protein
LSSIREQFYFQCQFHLTKIVQIIETEYINFTFILIK